MMALIAGWDWRSILEPRTLVFIVMGVVGFSAIFIPHWRRVREVEASTRLKLKMLDRGFSADEIERVINAGDEHPTSVRSSDDS